MKRRRRKLSAATKQKMSESKRGAKNPMYGRHHNHRTKEEIRRKLLEYWRQIPTG